VSQYKINWGDGNSDTLTAAQLAAVSNTVAHTYASAGTYTFSIDLTDEDGTYVDVNSINVTVEDPS
jgi:PKD repeat protein